MSYTHTLGYSLIEGSEAAISKAVVATYGAEANLDESIANPSLDQSLVFNLDVSKVRSVFLTSDQPLLLKINSSTAPVKYIWLKTNIPRVWSNDENSAPDPIINPFGSSNVTGLFATVSGISALSTPGAPTVTPQGTPGGTTYSYKITALNARGETVASSAGTTSTGNATLNGSNFNRLTWSAVTGAVAYRIYGRTSGNEFYMATVGAVLQYDDQGAATPSGAAPGSNTTGGGIASAAKLIIRCTYATS